ncbi:MAG: DUF61 family protein [Candidatus Bathyarchaeia archaeon]
MRRLFREEVRKLNLHLPRSRKSLKQLLNEKDPQVDSLGGEKLLFKRRDLEEAAKIVPENYHASLMLPLVLVRRMAMGEGVFTVTGGRLEKIFVRKVLGLTDKGFEDEAAENRHEVYLYRIQIQELLNRFDSLVIIGFGVPDDLLRE